MSVTRQLTDGRYLYDPNERRGCFFHAPTEQVYGPLFFVSDTRELELADNYLASRGHRQVRKIPQDAWTAAAHFLAAIQGCQIDDDELIKLIWSTGSDDDLKRAVFCADAASRNAWRSV